MRQKSTIKDIARECGVSLSTVSLVLNNNPRISPATCKKVMDAVKRNGYQPNAQARSLASKTSNAVAVVLPGRAPLFSDAHLGEILCGIYERAASTGHKVILEVANEQFVGKKEHLRMLDSRQVDGLLLLGACMRDASLKSDADPSRRILLVNNPSAASLLPSVSVDYAAAGRAAANHLLLMNHKQIGLIAGTYTRTGTDFHRAFNECCASAGVESRELPWDGEEHQEDGGKRAATEFMQKHPDLTAWVFGSDHMALGALHHLREAGRQVPADISVMGMGDLHPSRTSTPPMTTIALNLYAVGQRAMESLCMRFQNHQAPDREILPVHLIARSSTGPAPRS